VRRRVTRALRARAAARLLLTLLIRKGREQAFVEES
jgi:hypothetical protein